MATYYSNTGTCGGSSRRLYRAELTIETKEYDSYVAVSWSASVTMYNASLYGVVISCEGKEAEGFLSNANSSDYSTVATVKGEFTVNKNTSASSRTIVATASGKTVDGKGGADGSVSVSHSIAIPALPTSDVTFDVNGGIFPVPGQAMNGGAFPSNIITMTYNQTWYCYIRGDCPTRTGYTFKGWYTKKEGGEQLYNSKGNYVSGTYWKDVEGIDGGVWQYNKNLTVYAQWEANKYTLTLQANGGIPDVQTLTLIYDTNSHYGIETSTPKRPGHEFLGWYISADGGIKIYNSNGLCTNEGTYWKDDIYIYPNDITVYAQWNPLNIAYYKNDNKYVLCNTYGKVDGSWKPMLFYGKIDGTWKQSIIEE
jgi:uncharacterized repeat protein (TIGR02543 family)